MYNMSFIQHISYKYHVHVAGTGVHMQRLPKGCSNVSHIIRSCFNTFLTM